VVAKAIGLADELKPEIRKRCCTHAINASTPSWPSPLISGSTYFASWPQCFLSISRRRLGVRYVPQIDIAAGNRIDVGHFLSPSI